MGNSSLSLDVGQANEIKLALRRFDWTNELLKRLCENDCEVLGQALDLLRGDAKVVEVDHVVDLAEQPVGDGDRKCVVIKHVTYSKKRFRRVRLGVMNPRHLHYDASLACAKEQLLGRKMMLEQMKATELDPRTKAPRFLSGQKLANLNMRDFLLAHPHLIPECIGTASSPVLFWGSIFLDCHGIAWVPGIDRNWGEYRQYERRVDELGKWSAHFPTQYENPCAIFL